MTPTAIPELNEVLRSYCEAQDGSVQYLVQHGSSIHPDEFTDESDIDYLVVVDILNAAFVNNMPGRVSPLLDPRRVNWAVDFFWRVELAPLQGHRVTVTVYTGKKWLKYVEMRSPPKMYVLNDYRFLYGDGAAWAMERSLYRPNHHTAQQDFKQFSIESYHPRFLWAWRSVCLLRTGAWLLTKTEIRKWVTKAYYEEAVENRKLLLEELREALEGREKEN